MALAAARSGDQAGCMQFGGVLPPDAPDPRVARAEMAARLPVPLVRLVPQASLSDEDLGYAGNADSMSVSVSAVLWRNPADRDDPVNLAELDDAARRAVEEEPPWSRPEWLIAQVQLLRFPRLWEAVQTTWNRDASEYTTLDAVLLHHTRHILMNRFREEIGAGTHEWDSPAFPSSRSIRPSAVEIDGATVAGVEIDTDPFVYAVGAEAPTGGIVTAVIEREHLPYLDLRFTTAP
jgi:hypothetical protein